MSSSRTVALILLVSTLASRVALAQTFIRGDANDDGAVNMSDAIGIFGFLFLGGAPPACPDAADSDDNGLIELTDGVRILNVLFLGLGRIPAPYPAPGVDGTADRLSCRADPGFRVQRGTIVVPRVSGANLLAAMSGGSTAAASDAEGELVVILPGAGGEGGGGSTIGVEGFHLVAGSLELGTRGETGAILCRRSSRGAVEASFSAATGTLSASFPVEVSYPELLKDARFTAKAPDLKQTVLPVLGSAQLAAKVGDRGAIAGTLRIQLPDDVPVLGAHVLEWRFSGGWSLEDLEIDPEALGDRFRLKIGVVAQDAAGTGAVISQDEVETALAHANTIWSQCCIQLSAGPAATAVIEYIPANAFKGGDGDLFAVEDVGGFVGSDEQQFLWDYNDDPDAIEVVFAERFVVDGTNTFTAGVTSGGGGAGAAIIVETHELTPEGIGRVLAHEVGHALGIGVHSSSPDNLMYPELTSSSELDEAQCEEAHTDSPLPRVEVLCAE